MNELGFIQVTDEGQQEVLVPVGDIARIEQETGGTFTATIYMKDGITRINVNETITALLAALDNVRNAYLSAISGATRVLTVEAKAASFTISSSDSGKFLTTRGAGGAITATLPTVTSAFTGVNFWLFNCVNQNMGVAATTAGQIMFKNDTAADTVTYQQAGELIGAGFFVICDGTSWLVMPLAEETVTIAVT